MLSQYAIQFLNVDPDVILATVVETDKTVVCTGRGGTKTGRVELGATEGGALVLVAPRAV